VHLISTSAARSLELLAKHTDMLRTSNKVAGDIGLEGMLNQVVGCFLIHLIFDNAHGVLIKAMSYQFA
jgi:hypothetical protein